MATTAAGTPYVESSDLVANYPGVSLALANHIDTSTGKVLQVVRATDVTVRSTTSTSFVDVTGMSVTITPKKSTSAVIIIAAGVSKCENNSSVSARSQFRITDNSNDVIGGISEAFVGTEGIATIQNRQFWQTLTLFGYDTPATTSAKTYKLRFRSFDATVTTSVDNLRTTGQMYAIEVAV